MRDEGFIGGCRVQGLGGLGSRVWAWGFRFRVWGLGMKVYGGWGLGFGLRASVLGLRI